MSRACRLHSPPLARRQPPLLARLVSLAQAFDRTPDWRRDANGEVLVSLPMAALIVIGVQPIGAAAIWLGVTAWIGAPL